MLSRPTTEQILIDCRNELLNTIDPAVSAEPVKIAIQMMENVLRNCATRAAHEIAWMHEETSAMVDFARRVAHGAHTTPELTAALAAYEAGASTSLHLDDVAATYDLAGECLSAALEAFGHLAIRPPMVISLAKKEELIHVQGQAEPIRLGRENPGLRLCQAIRDEAHRFAQQYHHLLRRKRVLGED